MDTHSGGGRLLLLGGVLYILHILGMKRTGGRGGARLGLLLGETNLIEGLLIRGEIVRLGEVNGELGLVGRRGGA